MAEVTVSRTSHHVASSPFRVGPWQLRHETSTASSAWRYVLPSPINSLCR